MIYIYDILLNFTDTSKVYEFFEWNNKDDIEHIKKIALYKVSSKLMKDLLDFKVRVNSLFLKEIENECEIFKKNKVEKIEYASLFTDGKKTLAIEFSEDGKTLNRSHLLLDEEEEVLDLSYRLDTSDISYEIVEKYEETTFCTRNEEIIKKYLVKEIENSYQNRQMQKLNYIYQEFFNDKPTSIDVMYEKLVSSFSSLTDEHKKIYNLLKLTHNGKKQI